MTARRLARVAALACGLVLVVAIGGGLWWRSALVEPWSGWEGEQVDVVIEPGLAAGTMLRRLGDAGVVRYPRATGLWLRWRGQAGLLQAGEYRFERPASALDVAARLRRGDVLLHPVTLPEGLDRRETARRLAQAGFGSVEAFDDVFSDPAPIRDLDPDAGDLEGYLYPDTYHFPRGATPRDVARTMVDRFRDHVDDDVLASADASGLGLRGVVTLASLIEKETSVGAERARISRVFHNRLDRGMKLECDPTVIYAHEREGIAVGRLTYAHLRYDSPWNTYRYPGLPPGPIANPGWPSIAAVLEPVDGKELFFVAAPDGGHTFSRTHAAHLQAVAVWRRHVRSSR